MNQNSPLGVSLLLSSLMVGYSVGALAAPGTLANKPLFLGSEVQPNILFIVDDSGSMDWEVLKSNGALTVHGTGSNSGNMDFTPNDTNEIRELCSGYNVMAYDPTKTYTSWEGVDEDGVSYSDKTLTTALNNPYDNDDLDTLTNHFYIVWNDADSDGIYDNNECAVPADFGSELSASECTAATSACVAVSSLSSANQTNYANWYTYYRKREYVAKRALSEIITDSMSRVGMATLHNHNSVGTVIKDVDDISVPLSTTAQADKRALLKNLFRINSSNGTPLRQTLQRAGDYFEVGVTPNSGLFGFTPNPTSPILSSDLGGACQQNFSILMSDGTWNGSNPSVGNTDANTATNAFDGGSHADTANNTLADVAMHYYKRDLATSLTDDVPIVLGLDENDAQHMVTYTVAFGVNGTLTADPTNRTSAFSWPTPSSNATTTIDDMRHAAWNGRGEFLSAGDPDELIGSLAEAIQGIGDREGAASSVAFNSTSLETDTLVFQARFDSGGWHGTLLAFGFDENGVGSQKWDAANELDARNLVSNPRDIITFNGNKGIPFEFPSDYSSLGTSELSQAQVDDLLANSPNGVGATVGSEITENQTFGESFVDFLRGDFTNDGLLFRDRFERRLGDIVFSSPEFVGAPKARYPDAIGSTTDLYSSYVEANTNRDKMVYIGGNDGMLHAFDADTGAEQFAYIPGVLFSDDASEGLHYLAESDYTHLPYVDGSPLAADVYVNNQWSTYLVGGFRAGAKGIYVLDVTSPGKLKESFASSLVKMEFTHNDLGFTFSRPQVGKMNNGKWAAVFGNGYNNDPNGDGEAKLFIVYLDGSGFELIDTDAGFMVNDDCNDSSSDCNGLSSPTVVDLTGDGVVDRAYAGDLQGNLWAFDLSSNNSSKWSSAYFDNGSPEPLFIACTSTTSCTQGSVAVNRQPITTKPIVASHPDRRSSTTEPNVMVYVGTGQYIAENDNFTTDLQSMYGIWDAGANNAGIGRSNLQVQQIGTSSSVAGGRTLTTNDVNYNQASVNGAELGWYIDFPDSGERNVVEALVVGDIVFFNTMVPDDAACSVGGRGYIMFADRMSGGLPDFTVLDINNDGTFDDDIVAGIAIDAIPGGSRLIGDKIVTSDSSGRITDFGVQVEPSRPSRRASWSVIK